ncbi:probable WRKY transcription factor 32 [Camellia sinensis]|uniref:probable WRKY transcription factor 32 n=1 Tax=Camellia sinensis TaxID=4442 RepID=UPI001036D7F4|nr:probable WRKY transcription factor 32 [Camellia sinensis]
MDETKQRFEAEREREDDEGGEEDGGVDVEFDEVDDDDGGCGGGEVGGRERRSQLGEFDSCSLPPIEAQFRCSQSETLANSKIDLPCDFVASSHQLSEVPVDYALLRPLDSAEFKDQVGVSHQQAVSVTTQAAQVQSQNQLQSHGCPTSSPELSPNSATQSLSSAPSPTLIDQKLSPVTNASSACMAEMEPQNSSDRKTLSAVRVARTPSIDGFNWRKYGQKQVKSPQGSRSYYKCTYSDCYAKKIECCDHSNLVIEIISKGQHNHDPPRRINCTRESRPVLSSEPNTTAHPVRKLNDSDPSTSSRELIQETQALPEAKKQNSSDSDGTAEIDIKEEHVDEPEPKRRVKKSNSAYSDSLLKPGKKPKFVVHAAGDVGISGDGYRWRKYGQKMVKGNPHPRNYYRCTSAGCPVRKHIERAVESTNAVTITYKGVHDHDMPVPKKRHGPPSAPLVAAAAPASMNNLQSKKTEPVQNQNQNQTSATTQWSVDTQGDLKGEETLDAGEDKAMESARTLLSIGFEIKQC